LPWGSPRGRVVGLRPLADEGESRRPKGVCILVRRAHELTAEPADGSWPPPPIRPAARAMGRCFSPSSNSPSAAIRGRCHGGLREGGWLAYGHWLMRVSHDARRASSITMSGSVSR
jgi:hypothetical protein